MIKKLWGIFDRKQKIQIFGILIIIAVSSLLELLGVSAILPLIQAVTEPEIIDTNKYFLFVKQFLNIDSPQIFIVVCSLVLSAIYIIKNIYIIWMNNVLYKFTYFSQAKLSVSMMENYVYRDYQFHVDHNVAELNRNVESDVAACFYTVISVLQLIIEILVCILLVTFLALTDLETTIIISLLMSCLVLLFMLVFKKRIQFYGAKSRSYGAERSKWFLQTFNGIKEIKILNQEKFFCDRYDQCYHEYAMVMQRQQVLNNISKPMVEMFCISGILIFMSFRILAGADMSQFVPTLSVFAVAAFRMMPSFNRISGYLNAIMFNKASVDAVYNDVMEMKSILKQVKEERMAEKEDEWHIQEKISVKNLSFSYPARPDHEILKDISLDIPYKKSVAFVGSSGAGKTTLVDLILGVFQPDSGGIFLDGKNINANMRGWHKLIGYIPQSIYLLDDTVRRNVALGVDDNEIDEKKVWEVLEEAQLADFIREQPEGLDTNIGDRGVKLSGGQRQRIGIARALYTDPELLVLDEATSALDTETETAVMDAIFHLAGKLTMIVIAHRITTIRDCDHIFRIEDGKACKVTYEEIEASVKKTKA
ncbi:MAG: ABC transporter ATP-binding protein [Lachnospiraceae bacterium]|nr:ABC transporter ATP-binding protein [Lachnospiraceae bacterium]